MPKLLLVPLDDTVVFPTMDLNLPVDVSGEERVLLVPRHNGEYAKVGTVATVTDTIRLPGGGRVVTLESLHRAASPRLRRRHSSWPPDRRHHPAQGVPRHRRRARTATQPHIRQIGAGGFD